MICAIVLAAGRSKRMGVQKLLLPFAGKTVIAHIVDQVAAAPSVTHTLVVTGVDTPQVSQALEGRRLILVQNPDPDSEMLHSVRCGLAALPQPCTALLIVLGDQPSLRPQWIEKLAQLFTENDGQKIIVPTHAGHRGHPMIIPARFRDELLKQHDSTGLRGLLDAHAEDFVKVPWNEDAVLADMDYPEDYRRELDRLRDQP